MYLLKAVVCLPRTDIRCVAIKQDAADPDFAHMLKTVGVVQVPDPARRYDLAGVVCSLSNAVPWDTMLTRRCRKTRSCAH